MEWPLNPTRDQLVSSSHTNLAPPGTFCLADWYCIMQGSQLGQNIDEFSSPTACRVPSGIVYIIPQRELPVQFQLDFSVSCNQAVMSLAKDLNHLVLVGNWEQWQ